MRARLASVLLVSCAVMLAASSTEAGWLRTRGHRRAALRSPAVPNQPALDLATPEKTYATACKAQLEDDWTTEFLCLTPQSQRMMLAQLVFAIQWNDSHPSSTEPKEILRRHGVSWDKVTRDLEGAASRFKAIKDRKDLADVQREDLGYAMFVDVVNRRIVDPLGLYRDMMAWYQRFGLSQASAEDRQAYEKAKKLAREEQGVPALKNLKVVGNRATATARNADSDSDRPVAFERVAGRWRMEHDPR